MKKNSIKPAKKVSFKLKYIERSKKIKNLSISIISIVMGFLGIFCYFSKDKVDSKLDLMEINGKLYNYSFEEFGGIKSHRYDYTIYLSGYSTRFQISTELVGEFKRTYFEQNVEPGDSLRILISKNDYKKIGIKPFTSVFGIENYNGVYTEADNSIRAYNSPFTLLYGGLAFVIGGIFLILKDKIKPKD